MAKKIRLLTLAFCSLIGAFSHGVPAIADPTAEHPDGARWGPSVAGLRCGLAVVTPPAPYSAPYVRIFIEDMRSSAATLSGAAFWGLGHDLVVKSSAGAPVSIPFLYVDPGGSGMYVVGFGPPNIYVWPGTSLTGDYQIPRGDKPSPGNYFVSFEGGTETSGGGLPVNLQCGPVHFSL